ncbi:MAG: minor capsid protein [Clostridia bacterium]|nr:minor capsid protein [Clostridia bacterium]
MARKPKNYWEKRSTELMKRLEKGTENTINSLIQAYEQATKNINKEIARIFKNYAKDDVLTKEVLVKMLNKKETSIHYKNLLTVINNNISNEDIKKKLLAKYNAPAYSYRISRYEALQENIDIELKKLANAEQQITEIRYVNTIKEGYYHSIYDIQKGIGLGFNFAQIDNRTINLMLNENWTNNANFSQRIWNNSEKLGDYLKTQLTADTMSGKSIAKISKELSQYMNVGLYNATTLVRTEVNHFANESEMLAYEELGIEKYKFIATLDKVTCEHCAELDNKEFYVKDRQPGKNYPPIHPNDRCTTIAVFDDDVTEGLQRRARDENGKSILVNQDITYEQWKKDYMPVLALEQGPAKNKKELLNFQETINDFGKTKIKTNLYSDNIRRNNIIKYENVIMKKYKENKRENLAMLNAKIGNLIGKITTGTKTTVSPSLNNIIKLLNSEENSFILIHNHPKNYSFSLTDIKSYVRFKSIDTMIVKSPEYTFYLKALNRQIKVKQLETLYNKIENKINKKYKTFNGAEKRDLIVSELSKKMGWIYEKEKNRL